MRIKGVKKLMAALLALTLICGISPAFFRAQAAGPKLTAGKLTMTVGSTKKLKLKGAKASKVKWTSSKKSVVTVSAAGKLKAKKAGKAVITARYKGKKYKCRVTVKKLSGKISIEEKSVTVKKGRWKTVIVKTKNVDKLASEYYDDVEIEWGDWNGDQIKMKIKGLKADTRSEIKISDDQHPDVYTTLKVKVVK